MKCLGKQNIGQHFFVVLRLYARKHHEEGNDAKKNGESWRSRLLADMTQTTSFHPFHLVCFQQKTYISLLNGVLFKSFSVFYQSWSPFVKVHSLHLYEAPCGFRKALIVVPSESMSPSKIWEDFFFFFFLLHVEDH